MIGLLGGTFDPVHLGHLHIAKKLLQQLPFDEIRLLPCYQPVHRNLPRASPEDRLAMIQLAIKNEKKITVDDREIRRQGPSYMIDTLHSLREELGKQSIVLIVGADSFEHITTWKSWEQLIDFAHFVVVDRPDCHAKSPQIWKDRITDATSALPNKSAGLIYFANISALPISASAIREKIKQQKSIETVVPISVAQYILKQHLYI